MTGAALVALHRHRNCPGGLYRPVSRQVPYISNVINIPNILVCVVAAWILLKHGRGPFAAVSRVTAVILIADAVIMTFRALLTNLFYKQADLTTVPIPIPDGSIRWPEWPFLPPAW